MGTLVGARGDEHQQPLCLSLLCSGRSDAPTVGLAFDIYRNTHLFSQKCTQYIVASSYYIDLLRAAVRHAEFGASSRYTVLCVIGWLNPGESQPPNRNAAN